MMLMVILPNKTNNNKKEEENSLGLEEARGANIQNPRNRVKFGTGPFVMRQVTAGHLQSLLKKIKVS